MKEVARKEGIVVKMFTETKDHLSVKFSDSDIVNVECPSQATYAKLIEAKRTGQKIAIRLMQGKLMNFVEVDFIV